MFRSIRIIIGHLLFYYDQQMHTIISQIITLLHVSTLLCNTQGTCNQCFQYMYRAFLLFCAINNKCTQLFHKLSHCYMFRLYCVILRELVINAFKICTVHFYYFVLSPTNAHNYFTNYHTATCFDTIVSSSGSLLSMLSKHVHVHLLLFCAVTNKCTKLFHKLSHCYMFRLYRVILRELVINAFNTCTRASFVILCCDQQMHTIISQIITTLHVSTLSCYPQGACNQCFQYMYRVSCIILYYDQQMHTIISQIITTLHVSTLSCHPQGVCNQCFQYMYTCIFCYFVLRPTNALNYFTNYHSAACFDTIVSSSCGL